MRTILSLLFVLISASLIGQHDSSYIGYSFNQALSDARMNNRMICLMIVPEHAENCISCREKFNHIFKDDYLQSIYEDHFINVSTDPENPEIQSFLRVNEVEVFPSLVFMDKYQIVLHRIAGLRENSDYENAALDVINGRGLKYYEDEFYEGNMEVSFVKEYAELLHRAGMSDELMVEDFYNSLDESRFLDDDIWEITVMTSHASNSMEISHLIARYSEYVKKYGEDDPYRVLREAFIGRLNGHLEAEPFNEEHLESFMKGIKDNDLVIYPEFNYRAKLRINKYRKKWESYTKLAAKDIQTYSWNEKKDINEICTVYLENIKDPKQLMKAVRWMERSITLKEDAPSYHLIAGLYYKAGKVEEALEFEQKAIDTGVRQKVDIFLYIETLEEYKSG